MHVSSVDKHGMGGAGGRMTPLSWLLATFTIIGMVTVYRWCFWQFYSALSLLDEWATERAHNLCGQAILDYEFDRGVDALASLKFAHMIMRGGSK